VIDRAEDRDADAVLGARNRPDGGEQPPGSSTALRAADSAAADESPADDARTDAVPLTAEQRATAYRRYRDTVDHTSDMARVEAGQDAQSEAQEAPPSGATARDETPERDADQDQEASQRRVAGEDEEGTARDGDTETRSPRAGDGPNAGDREAGAPGAEDSRARDAWAEAVTELRAEWEKHEQRFPERSRLTPTAQLDGGWLADGNRRLTPEQNTDASKACEDIRAEGKEVILPAMKRVEGADPDRRLAGLEHMLKGEDRLKEKIADEITAKPELTISKAMDTVVDSVRFTFTYNQQRYAEGIPADVERLKSEGFELVKLKNLWTDDQYKGVNSQWRRPETGLRFEVQFHTAESLSAKELTHKAYERIRSAVSPEERREMKAYQRQVNALLVTPPGTAEIKDFPEKR
jgi:hypothetical protein